MELLLPATAYLLGSIPFSYLVARRWGVDVRQVGSRNVGATNVLRSAGKLPGLIAFVLDAAKGAAAVWLVLRIRPDGALPALAAVAAVLGHVFPVWLGFRGGKGVATGAGVFLPLCPGASLGAALVFALVLAATRFVSVGSVAAAVALVALLLALDAPLPVRIAGALLAALIVFKHRENLARLRSGTERRLGGRA